MDLLKNTWFLLLIAVIFLVGTFISAFIIRNSSFASGDFNTFASCWDLENYVFETIDYNYGFPVLEPSPEFFRDGIDFEESSTDSFSGEATPQVNISDESTTIDFSETNIQVDGVDESDIVKTDGNDLYTINNNKIFVFDVTDPENTSEVTSFDVPGNPLELFLTEEYLILLSTDSSRSVGRFSSDYWSLDNSEVGIFLYDRSDNPELKREIKLEGNYKTARLTDNTVYLISTNFFSNYNRREITAEDVIPKLSDSKVSTQYSPAVECNQISYYGSNKNNISSVLALNLDNEELNTKVIIGDTQNIYMSRQNLYLATVVYDYGGDYNPPRPIPFLDFLVGNTIVFPEPDYYQEPIVTTEIYKLGLDKNSIEFSNVGMVEGIVLNQFSMDEFDGNFRIATTTNDLSGWNADSENNLFILNNEMEIIGELRGLGLDERIFSTRFVGERVYMVTFRQVDPFYVIDTSDETNPIALGELKIPGFSDYLHPYDENHIIGVGKDADPNSGRAEGVKVALFDVRDPKNPVERDVLILGAQISDTSVSRDHKSFLFDRERELLILPVSLRNANTGEWLIQNSLLPKLVENEIPLENISFEINDSTSFSLTIDTTGVNFDQLGFDEILNEFYNTIEIDENNLPIYSYEISNPINTNDENQFIGFSIIDIRLDDNALEERGRVTNKKFEEDDYYYFYGTSPRSLYINNTLFTIRDNELNTFDLESLERMETFELD